MEGVMRPDVSHGRIFNLDSSNVTQRREVFQHIDDL